MGRLVQNYRIKFTNKHASSFGTWWEVGDDDQVKRIIRKVRTVQQKRKRLTRQWLYTLFFRKHKSLYRMSDYVSGKKIIAAFLFTQTVN